MFSIYIINNVIKLTMLLIYLNSFLNNQSKKGWKTVWKHYEEMILPANNYVLVYLVIYTFIIFHSKYVAQQIAHLTFDSSSFISYSLWVCLYIAPSIFNWQKSCILSNIFAYKSFNTLYFYSSSQLYFHTRAFAHYFWIRILSQQV